MFSSNTTQVSAAAPDPQFNYVTMLLHGDGTNGAQNNTFLDSGPNTFTITRNGNTTQGSFSPYGSNWANYFDGSSYLELADNTAFTFTADFTIECWFFVPSTPSGNCQLVSKWGANQEFILEYGVRSASNARQVRFFWGPFNTSTAFLTSPNDAFVIGTWNHVAVTRSGSSCTMWINGSSVVTGTNGTAATDGSNVLRIATYSGGTADFVTGYISNMRLVKGTAVYTSSFTPSTTPLTAITNTVLLTCQSNRFIDNSTNNFAITTSGSPSVQRFNPFGTSTAYSTSVIGGSGYFDGSGDYLSTSGGTATAMGTGDFTWEVFVYVPAATTYQTFIETRSTPGPGANDGFFFGLSTGTLTPIVYTTSTLASSTKDITAGSWNHVAVTRSGTNLTFWINGVSGGTTTNLTNLSSQPVYIGNSTTTNVALTGFLSNVRMVKGTAVYTTTFTPPTAPLTAISGTSLLANFINGAIFDNAMMNNLETVGNAQISTSVKKYGTGSIAFDGTGDYLQAPDSPVFNLGSGNWTIESWIYINSAKNYNGFYGKRQAGQFGLTLQIDNSGVLSISASITGSSWALAGASLGSGYTTGAWMHVAVTRSGTTITGWLNGTSTGTQTLTGAIFPSTGYPAVIGSAFDTGSAQDLNGYMDDFRLTNGFCRYTTTFTPPTAAFPNIGPV